MCASIRVYECKLLDLPKCILRQLFKYPVQRMGVILEKEALFINVPIREIGARNIKEGPQTIRTTPLSGSRAGKSHICLAGTLREVLPN